jgi:hypothetical protein
MTKPILSLLVPTRGHVVDRLQRLWRSLTVTIETQESVELIFRIDEDDEESAAFLATIDPKPVVLVGPRYDGYASLPRFYNEMVQHTTADLIMCGNDDMIFKTPEWAYLYRDVSDLYSDGVFCLGAYTYPTSAFPFSVVSRRMVDALGFLNDERLLYSDIFLRDVVARAGGRALLVPEVEIEHVGVCDADCAAVKMDMHEHFAEKYWQLHDKCVWEAVAKVRPLLRQTWRERLKSIA